MKPARYSSHAGTHAAAVAAEERARARGPVLACPSLLKSLCYVDGRWVHSEDGASVVVTNPATGDEIGHVPLLGQTQIRAAVDAAARAFDGWRATPLAAREHMLREWARLITTHAGDLARIMTLEQGKPLAEARGEIAYAASFIPWFAEEAKRAAGRNIPSHLAGSRLGTLREPVGVAVLVTPWNFPCAMITRKAAAALAAGCTVVVKPAHETPYSAFALADLAEQAGIPAGVFNVVLGEPQATMHTLLGDARVRALSFTGSTRVGRLLQAAGAGHVRNVALELGGNAPFIVTADCDLDEAVRIAVATKFQSSGQDCLAADRLLVHRSQHEAFLERFARAAQGLRVGDGFDPQVDIGPLIGARAVAAACARVEAAIGGGARLLAGGSAHPHGGCFFTPTVLADVDTGMAVWREENFAPVAAVRAFDTLDEAIALANDTEYGLAAYVCGERLRDIDRVLHGLRFGMVAVNTAKMTGPPVPFGGVKGSGLGREGASEGLDTFLDTKYFCLGGLDAA